MQGHRTVSLLEEREVGGKLDSTPPTDDGVISDIKTSLNKINSHNIQLQVRRCCLLLDML